MQTKSFNSNRLRIALGTIALVLLAIPADAGADQTHSFAPVCAARDLEVVNLIEQHGQAQDMASERVANATMTMMQAREACAAGRTDEALAVYDGIIGSLNPMLSHRQQ